MAVQEWTIGSSGRRMATPGMPPTSKEFHTPAINQPIITKHIHSLQCHAFATQTSSSTSPPSLSSHPLPSIHRCHQPVVQASKTRTTTSPPVSPTQKLASSVPACTDYPVANRVHHVHLPRRERHSRSSTVKMYGRRVGGAVGPRCRS